MGIEKDHIWEVFTGAETFEAFQKNLLTEVYLNPQVPDDVRDLILIAQKLLKHSYFEYEFIDVALTHAIFAFEKALKIRWTEIHGESTKKMLAELIDWFYDNNYFEASNKEVLHNLRQIRNNKAHDERKSLGGVAYMQKVYITIDFINDLYENPSLRIQRKKETELLTEQFNSLFKKAAILTFNNQRLIVFSSYPVFIDNKSARNILSLSVCPIFDLSAYKNGMHFIPEHIQFSLSDWKWGDDRFTATDIKSGKPVIISTIDDDTNKIKFEAWEAAFYGSEKWPTILFLITEPLNDYFLQALRNFHQQ
jgi:hypothetical protein